MAKPPNNSLLFSKLASLRENLLHQDGLRRSLAGSGFAAKLGAAAESLEKIHAETVAGSVS